MPEDFFDELIGKRSDDLDDILDKIKNRWETDLTAGDWIKERDEEPPQRDLPKSANRSRKNNKANRRRK